MRILDVNSYYSTGLFYKNLFDAQARLGVDVRVYVPVARGYASDADFGPYTDIAPVTGRWDKWLFHYKYGKVLADARARYANESFDLIHAHSLFSNGYVANALARERGVPYVVAVRDGDANVFFKYMPHLRGTGRRILRDAARVIFISPRYRDGALKPYLPADEFEAVRQKSIVLPNGIDRFWLDNPAPPKPAPQGEVKLLLVGQIIPRKRIPLAAEAARLLSESGVPAALTVVGKPVDGALCEQLKAMPRVTVLPPRPLRDLLPVYRASDIFALPSARETFGLVYAEALSQGLPVLFTRGQGFDGQCPEGEVGFPVEGSAESIAEGVKKILAVYPEMSARCIQNASRFDWDAIARDYQNLYRACLDGAAGK